MPCQRTTAIRFLARSLALIALWRPSFATTFDVDNPISAEARVSDAEGLPRNLLALFRPQPGPGWGPREAWQGGFRAAAETEYYGVPQNTGWWTTTGDCWRRPSAATCITLMAAKCGSPIRCATWTPG